jgi:outer membrane receptor protein involved in Fe transport
MNFFTSYGINNRSRPGKGTSFQRFDEPDTSFAYQQNNVRNRGGTSHNLRAGVDYFLDSKNTITGAFLIRGSNGVNTSNYEYLDLNENNEVIRRVERNEREEEPEINSEISLSYRREFDKKDKQLSADFKWIENVETEKATFDQIDYSNDSIIIQRSNNGENERNLLAQVDFVNPFGKKGKWETGARSTMRILNNDFLVEQQDAEGAWNVLQSFNNNLVYTENIHAFYGMIGNEIDRFSFQGGIRGELSDIKVELRTTDEENTQLYFNLFPSAHFSYKIKPEKTVQLSYSYRISRPRFRELLPFSNFSDSRSQWSGNPNLKPEYTNSIEAGYLMNWETGSILSSVYYRYRTGVIDRITVTQEDAGEEGQVLTRTFPVNLSTEDAYGLEFNFTWNPVKWWRFNSNANFYRAITQGEYEGQPLFSDTYTWTSRTTSILKFFKSWDFQMGARYRAPRQTPQGERKSVYSIDLGLSKDIFKKNGTLTASVRDLLNSRIRRSTTVAEGYYSNSEFQWRARQLTLTFTYRLNQRKQSQMEDEYDNDQPDQFQSQEFNEN